MTTIDIKRVNIVEKDIEDWLWENPLEFGQAITGRHYSLVDLTWYARQYRLPSGILDLFGVVSWELAGNLRQHPVIVEVKNQPITSGAITQVCRYAWDLEKIIEEAGYAGGVLKEHESSVLKYIVCPSEISDMLLFEANAVGVALHTFSAHLHLNLHGALLCGHNRRERRNWNT